MGKHFNLRSTTGTFQFTVDCDGMLDVSSSFTHDKEDVKQTSYQRVMHSKFRENVLNRCKDIKIMQKIDKD